MKFHAIVGLLALSGHTLADVIPQGDQGYLCQTTGGFFDFSPSGAIAACREEIDEFCKSKGAPHVVGKITGEPSGAARFAKAEIKFQCMTAADIALKKKEHVEAKNQQVRAEIENSKQMCQQDFGFAPNTPEFSNCLLELQKQRFEDHRVAQGIAAQNEIAEVQVTQQRQSAADQATMGALQMINQSVNNMATINAAQSMSESSNRALRDTAQSINQSNSREVRTDCHTYGSNISCATK